MNTRKYPRTMEEAFGPYARGPIQEQQDPMPQADRVVIGICLVAGMALFLMVALGWIQ